MRLTRFTDYALRVLIHLAEGPERTCSIAEIAQSTGASHNHLMKVVNRLGQCGYVRSTRGRRGGIRLAGPANAIPLGLIVRDMEQEFVLIERLEDAGPARSALSGVLSEALTSFFETLDGYSLADLMRVQAA